MPLLGRCTGLACDCLTMQGSMQTWNIVSCSNNKGLGNIRQGQSCLPCSQSHLASAFPKITWADWRADERRRRGHRCCRFHRSQTIRQRTVASRIKASPRQPGFPCAPLQEAPAPFPSRIPERNQRRRGEKKEKGEGGRLWEWNSCASPSFSRPQVISQCC